MPPEHPSVVVFDIGGVLIDWNPRHLYRKLLNGDEAGMERFLAEVCTPAWNVEMDAGRRFAEAIAELVARHPAEAELIRAYFDRWPEMIAGPIDGTVELLEALHAAGWPLYAITNWSQETLPLVRHRPEYAFLDRFRDIFVSGELRMVKPAEPIFRHALAAMGTSAEACFYIDDSAANVATADRLGMRAHRYTDPERLAADLRRHGLLD
jgi:2-haloacid dehalogenase